MNPSRLPFHPAPDADRAWESEVVLRSEGAAAPLSMFGLADALLKAPVSVAQELNANRSAFTRVLALVAACMLMTGLVTASF